MVIIIIITKAHKYSKTQSAHLLGSSTFCMAAVQPMRQQMTLAFLMNEALSNEPIFNTVVHESLKPYEASFGHRYLPATGEIPPNGNLRPEVGVAPKPKSERQKDQHLYSLYKGLPL